MTNLLHWNFKIGFRWYQVIASGVLSVFIGWWGLNQASNFFTKVNIKNVLLISSGGPALEDMSLLSFSVWFIPHLLFLYFWGDMTNEELLSRGYMILPLAGSRKKWWLSKVLFLGGTAVIYTAWCLILTLFPALLNRVFLFHIGEFPSQMRHLPTYSGETILVWIFCLLATSLFALVLWQSLIAIWWRHSVYGLVVNSVLIIFSWLLGTNNPILVPWLPGTQSILLRHSELESSISHFSVLWSLSYNFLLILCAIILGNWYIHQIDILGEAV